MAAALDSPPTNNDLGLAKDARSLGEVIANVAASSQQRTAAG
jgi:hypothetical protein